ncbi:MAG: type II toxin-antitoxin system PemK/MazF family toxin [Actinomycetes bacterium]
MIRRGSIHLIDFEPAGEGSEANKVRPGVIVSNDSANTSANEHGRGVITVCPVTSNVSRVLPFQVFLPLSGKTGLDIESKVQAEQVRAIDVRYVGNPIGALSREQLAALDGALRLHLAL